MSLKSLPIQSFKMCKNVQKKLKNSIDTALLLCEIDRTHGTNRNNNNQKMRTKTLLIAAAALAAAVTSSQAQTVYSANIVGYANLGITAGSYELITPTFDVDGTGTNGTISTVVGTNVDAGTLVLIWNGTGYSDLSYQSTSGRGSALGWVLLGTTPVVSPNYPVNVGEGLFVNDPGPNVTNLTVSGVVMQGTLPNPYVAPAGTYALLGSMVPISGDLDTNLDYVPNQGDLVLEWNGNGFNDYSYQSESGRGSTIGWVLLGTTPTVSSPQVSVGQGFFLNPAATTTWTETFTNN